MRLMKSYKFLTPFFSALLLTCASPLVLAQTYKVLHTFRGPDGANPSAPVILDAAGNIYGTTQAGGAGKCWSEGCGTAFVLNRTGTEIGLHSFTGADGWQPFAGLLLDSKGNLFGTTVLGGSESNACGGEGGCGVAFRLGRNGKEVQYKFQGAPNGDSPTAPLVEDRSGNLYGTTASGGQYGVGTVFKVDGTTGKESVLYSFTGGSDGCFPHSGVILDLAGNLYGATNEGGDGFCNDGAGVIFEVDSTGNETVLHTFLGPDGANPISVLLFDSAGNLYGTTQNGGASDQCGFSGCGTAFELSPGLGGTWSQKVLYSFCSLSECADGESPLYGPLVRDTSGNLFGTTIFGGKSGYGVVFELNPSGVETVLYSFSGASDGGGPQAGLATDVLGNLYGTAETGGGSCYGQYTCGVVFKITR